MTSPDTDPRTAADSRSETTPAPEAATEGGFVETALKLGGKSEEEARATGAVDRADEQVEALFAEKYRTAASPVHRAVWDDRVPIDLFTPQVSEPDAQTREVMERSLEVIRRRRLENRLLNDEGKISDETFQELAEVGYWGLLVDKEYGGCGAPFATFARFLTRVATIDPTLAGLASVHGCIGAVDPLRTFGSQEQKRKYLPLLASGQKLSAFALTEPGAGSDLTALRTTARREGDHFVVNGEKLFITNAIPGRTIGLVCLIDGKPAVLIVDLPPQEDEHFQIVRYGLHALKHSYNNGLRFRDFRVPAENLLQPKHGDGLTIAYHGLNRGRVALCATAAGTMRVMLASILPWAHYRKTYGEPIVKRELVRRRISRLGGFIVACDALTEWCGWLLDEGFRGEMECIVAKIFGSEAQKEAAIELFMKTHGGRAFLHGHLFGDYVHEFLAPCIYEGEGEMLGMAFFKSLIKEHGRRFFEPIGKALMAAGIRKPNPLNPAHAWALRKAVAPYLLWKLKDFFRFPTPPRLPRMPRNLREHAQFAATQLQRSHRELDALMTRYQLSLADRQLAMSELSQRIQSMVVMLVTALHAARQNNELVTEAATVLCDEIQRHLAGRRPTTAEFKRLSQTGAAIAEGGFPPLEGVMAPDILMKYDQ